MTQTAPAPAPAQKPRAPRGPAAFSDEDEALPGGGFLAAPVPRRVFCREALSDEQKALAEVAERFVQGEVWPRMEAIEEKAEVDGPNGKEPLVISLVRQAAEIGLCSIEMPESAGGLDADLATAMHVAETLRACASFAATLGAHNGIGAQPIVYFGSDAQKAAWLPRLASAEKISCYALTEPGNGSDALAGKTTAARSPDGTHFVLDGQKQFITNGSWADVGIVFAHVDGKYSALIVDLHAEGVTRGAEEKKMGIKGSSTTGLVFQGVKVPVENLLGEVGDAAKIAFNILYHGRMKLGFASLGTAKHAIDLTVKFMQSRRAFGRPIIEFDLQERKLAECVAWAYACDSLCYRVVGLVERDIQAQPDPKDPQQQVAVLRRYGLECAAIKVHGSETCSRVLYHALRMHGGYGFCQEYQVERLMRDNVVETIYEGTNDINRVVLSGAIVESCALGAIPFRERVEAVHARLRAGDLAAPAVEGWLAPEAARVAALKDALCWFVEEALIGVGGDAKVEQQVLCGVADAALAFLAAESALAHTHGLGAADPQADARADATRLAIDEAGAELARCGRDALLHVTPPSLLPDALATFERLLARGALAQDLVEVRRRLARHAARRGGYSF